MMRIGSLFSGAAGLDRAVEAVFSGEVVWFAEIDKAASKVLAYHYPDVPNLGSVTDIDWATVPPVDIICGGFPCTDVSAAGKRAGMHGTRSGLWSHMAEAIDVLRPRYVVIENVRGLLNANANRPVGRDEDAVGYGGDGSVLRAIGAVFGDLADIGGYEARWVTLAAASVGAPHRRERVFILATDTSRGELQRRRIGGTVAEPSSGSSGAAEQRKRHGDAISGSCAATSISGGAAVGESVSPGVRCVTCGKVTTHSIVCRYCGSSDVAVSRDGDVALLPTPRASDPANSSSHSSEGFRPQLGEVVRELLPTPNASDCSGGGMHPDSRYNADGLRHSQQLIDAVKLEPERFWGKYEPAIRRWEAIVGPAPAPTEPNKNGNPRLSAAFSQWLMGWPSGWVTDPAIGISRNDQLRIVGNGVCSQQAVAALRFLLGVATGTHTHTHSGSVLT